MLVVMTGGTRGLGRVAAEQIDVPETKIMGARNPAAVPAGWQAKELDLANLDSVRTFATTLPDGPISHLILNAGIQSANANGRTVDGFEATFATNHLAHYLLLRLLMPRLASSARIVITSSGTHDPAENTGVPTPRHANAAWLAHPEYDPNLDRVAAIAGLRAYSASKLCNLMTARYLAQTEAARVGGWSIFAYDPGLTPSTGLARNHPWPVRALVWPLLPLFVPLAKGMNTLADAGRGLSGLAISAQAPAGRFYASLRKGHLTWPNPSQLACDDDAVAALWEESAQLVGTV
jgi:NAD(P)-dependent dehydrogenase (short-subunit alcohol dehydrogenase family)